MTTDAYKLLSPYQQALLDLWQISNHNLERIADALDALVELDVHK